MFVIESDFGRQFQAVFRFKEERMTQEQSKVPFQDSVKEKKSKKFYYLIGSLALVIVVLAYFLFKGPAGPKMSPKMKQMEETVQQIQQLESNIQEKQNEVFNILNDYKKKTGEDLPEVNIMNLSPEQKKVLEEKIKNEKDVSIKSLLQDILDKNNDIQNLNAKVQELEALLPKPHLVEKGENHYQIAMNYLLNEKGVDKARAMELVERTALFEPIIPGFKVWNFYAEDEYGTFITQGTAPISPNQIQRKVKKELVDAKDKAIAEKDQLQSDITEMEVRRTELISQLDLLNQEKQNMLVKMSDLNDQNQEMQTALNSVFYAMDLRKNLTERGIIKGGFLRSTKLQKVDVAMFDKSLDLRGEAKITAAASDFQLARINDVSIYPSYFKANVDFKIEFDQTSQNVTITILDVKKFMSERIAIALE
jgi:type II secretory pathway component PulM